MRRKAPVDPAFLWILPQYLELKPEAVLSPPANQRFPDTLRSNEHVLFVLSYLTEPCTERDSLREWLDGWRFIEEHTLDLLRDIGVDVKGGPDGLVGTKWMHVNGKWKFPTTYFIIRDADKAGRYIDIGHHVDPTLKLQRPETLAEAAQSYTEIVALVDGEHGLSENKEDLAEKIQHCMNGNERWSMQREHFRLSVKEQYEDRLIEMSQELELEKLERFNEYLNKKRREMKRAELKRKRDLKQRLKAKVLARMEIDEEKRECRKFSRESRGLPISLEDMEPFDDYMLREERKRGRRELDLAIMKRNRSEMARRMFVTRSERCSTLTGPSESETDSAKDSSK